MAIDSQTEIETTDRTTSRRRALKLGAGAGVGAIAWSGVTITSLGGTPAYAAGCTFVVRLDLSGGCRNTDQATGADFGYHTLKTTGFPTGYSIQNNIAEGTACNAGAVSQLIFPAGITCLVTIDFNGPGNCSGADFGTLTYGPLDAPANSSGSLNINFACIDPAFPSSTQYQIVAHCNTTGAPPGCLT